MSSCFDIAVPESFTALSAWVGFEISSNANRTVIDSTALGFRDLFISFTSLMLSDIRP
jgi:hypothetical protein